MFRLFRRPDPDPRSLLRYFAPRTFATDATAWRDAGPLFSEPLLLPSSNNDAAATPKLAVVLHGLLGVGRNLRSFTQLQLQTKPALSENAPPNNSQWTAALLDLPNHGRSPASSPPHSLEDAARHVIETIENSWNGDEISLLIGHSLGGKVALEVVRQLAEGGSSRGLGPPRQVWTLDSTPFELSTSARGPREATAGVRRVLETVGDIPIPIPSRDWLYEYLNKRGFSRMLQQWLGSNLKLEKDGGYTWQFNLDGARAMYSDYLTADCSSVLSSPPAGTEVHVVIAGGNPKWDDAAMKRIETAVTRSGRATKAHVVPNVGHWLHSEQPRELAKLMAPHFARI
jgi:pimeloyl-ACP methyl ester carboxylesterase